MFLEMFNVFIAVESIVLICVFIFKGFDFYLRLIPVGVLFRGVTSLYVD